MVVGCQPYAPAAFTPRNIPGTHFHYGLSRPPRTMVWSEGNMSLKNPVTTPGIDPGTVRLRYPRLGDDSNGHMVMCLILNCYRNRAVWFFITNSVRVFFVGLDEERSLQKEDVYTRHFGCCEQREETWRSVQRNTQFAEETEVDGGIFENLLCEL